MSENRPHKMCSKTKADYADAPSNKPAIGDQIKFLYISKKKKKRKKENLKESLCKIQLNELSS